MRIFKTRVFHRFTRKSGIDDAMLRDAIDNAEQGLIDADLGGGVIKQRIARPGRGKSGCFRTIVLFRKAERAVFVYGFAKNERDNIRDDELAAFGTLAATVLTYSDEAMTTAVASGALIEVTYGQTIP